VPPVDLLSIEDVYEMESETENPRLFVVVPRELGNLAGVHDWVVRIAKLLLHLF
jgi:hypothetical protein